MKKSKKNIAEKYLSQKRNSVAEIAFTVLFALGVICFFAYSKFLSIPIITVSACFILFIKTSKIKDSEYDEIVTIVLREHGIELDESKKLSSYDIAETPLTIGADKKARTPVFSIATFEFSQDACKIKTYIVNVIERSLNACEYEIALGSMCRLEHISVDTKAGKRAMEVMCFDEYPELRIPTEKLSYDAEEIVKKISRVKK